MGAEVESAPSDRPTSTPKPSDKADLNDPREAVGKYRAQGRLEEAKTLLESALENGPTRDGKKIDRYIELAEELDAVKAAIASRLEETDLANLRTAVERYKAQGHLEDAKNLLDSELEKTLAADKENVSRRIELVKGLGMVETAISELERERIQGIVKKLADVEHENEKKMLLEQLRAALKQQTDKQNIELAAQIERALQKNEEGGPGVLVRFLRTVMSVVSAVALKAGRVVLEVLVWFVFLACAVVLFLLARQKLARGHGLALEDETASEENREKANRELNMLMAHEMYAIERGETIGVEAAGLSDQAGAGSTVDKLAKLDTLIDDTPVKVGVVSFSPRQIFLVLAQLFSRQHKYVLKGSLTRAHGMTSLTVTKRPTYGTFVESECYHASGKGTTNAVREQVVRDVAIQFATQNVKSVVTQDWKSLRAYLEAEEVLKSECTGPNRNELLAKALATLQRSLRHDPSNWMARYNAGIVLRRLSRHKDAADQFDYLRKMLRSPGFRESKCYADFNKRHTDFEWMVRYNLALSWAETENERDIERALRMVEKLLQEAHFREDTKIVSGWLNRLSPKRSSKTDEPAPPALAEVRLIVLARSAHAVARTMYMDHLRQQVLLGEKTEAEIESEMEDSLNQVDADERWIWSIISQNKKYKIHDWEAYARAHSAAQSARGRAHYLSGNYMDALTYLRWAVSIHAPEAFVQPFVHMAEVVLQLKLKYAVDWARQAEEYLNKALEINSTHPKAHHLLGLVFADPSEERYAEAHKEFDAAGDYWPSLADHARLLCKEDKDYARAIKLLNKSLGFKCVADDRVSLLCNAISKLDDAEEELIREGIYWAKFLESQGLTPELQLRGESLKNALEKKLKTLRQIGNTKQPGTSK
jgi:tetratricopeptide (TPR) repeat protein